MKYWAVVWNTWQEAWAKKTAVVLAVVVGALLVSYAVGLRVESTDDPGRVDVYVFGIGATPDPGVANPIMAFSRQQVATFSALGALGLLTPWGVVLALFITTALLSGALQAPRLCWVLSKPLARSGFLLGKFGGALLLVLGTTAVFVLCMSGLIAWKLNTFSAALIGGGLLVVFDYAVLSSVALLVAVWTQNTSISLVAALAVYGGSGAFYVLHGPQVYGMLSPLVRDITDALYLILPKTADVEALSRSWVSAQGLDLGELTYALGSSATFMVAMLGLSLWAFGRRDF